MRAIRFILMALAAVIAFSSCERVAPNYAGVLMENYGKDGKSDFKVVSGKVSTIEWGTELFQVPLFDQRGEFAEPVTLKAADNTEFNARPTYSYKVIKERAVEMVIKTCDKHFYDEDNIKVKPVGPAKAVVADKPAPTVKLSAKEKEAAKEEARRLYQQECLAEIAKKEAKKKRRPAPVPDQTPSLFEGFDL